MAEEQQSEAKPSLLARVFGSRIAQALGIFGVAFTLFQGLEPFLKFSRLMGYLVDHWREWTRGLWSWLASFVYLDLPAWALDLLTAAVFVVLFTARNVRYRYHAVETIGRSALSMRLLRWADWLSLEHRFLKDLTLGIVMISLAFMFYLTFLMDESNSTATAILIPLILVISILLLRPRVCLVVMSMLVIPLVIFVSLYPHFSLIRALAIAIIFGFAYARTIETFMGGHVAAIVGGSERAMFVLIGILALNYLAIHSRPIEVFIEKATQ